MRNVYGPVPVVPRCPYVYVGFPTLYPTSDTFGCGRLRLLLVPHTFVVRWLMPLHTRLPRTGDSTLPPPRCTLPSLRSHFHTFTVLVCSTRRLVTFTHGSTVLYHHVVTHFFPTTGLLQRYSTTHPTRSTFTTPRYATTGSFRFTFVTVPRFTFTFPVLLFTVFYVYGCCCYVRYGLRYAFCGLPFYARGLRSFYFLPTLLMLFPVGYVVPSNIPHTTFPFSPTTVGYNHTHYHGYFTFLLLPTGATWVPLLPDSTLPLHHHRLVGCRSSYHTFAFACLVRAVRLVFFCFARARALPSPLLLRLGQFVYLGYAHTRLVTVVTRTTTLHHIRLHVTLPLLFFYLPAFGYYHHTHTYHLPARSLRFVVDFVLIPGSSTRSPVVTHTTTARFTF